MTSAAQRLRDWRAETAIVLGSGLNSVVADNSEAIAYSEFPEIPSPRVAGHVGRFARGEKLIYAQGRVHLYEGHTADDVTAIIRVLAAAGIKRLILTNAAGSLNLSFAPGSWMMISDHLNLTGMTPLLGRPEFIDMSDTYSSTWRAEFRSASQQLDMRFHEGVYAGLLGPQYETPAEVRMVRNLGADAVGMSTVLEAIQARALGIDVAGFSCLTNWAAGVGNQTLSHDEVLEVGRSAAAGFARLLSRAI
ncbi:MAG: purine-nucleoside phosphorylase [Chthoniobacterales bacterium]